VQTIAIWPSPYSTLHDRIELHLGVIVKMWRNNMNKYVLLIALKIFVTNCVRKLTKRINATILKFENLISQMLQSLAFEHGT